ncbi:MAG: PEF-CTERM sorting domain-containing protein [Candidatus Methanoperedens sp.]|nr:PEF-CTERM sorting domain-containing protein [Candidatus Methanoperedens sp.]
MRNILKVIGALLIVMSTIVSTAIAPPPSQNCNGGVTGKIQATTADYSRETDIFYLGEEVYLTGANIAKNFPGGIIYPLVGQLNWNVYLPDENTGVSIASGTAELTSINPLPSSVYKNQKPAYIIPVNMLEIKESYVGQHLKLIVTSSGEIGGCSYEFRAVDTLYGEIPEFPTVALPIAAVIGLVFFFQHKKRKEE